MTIEGGHGSSRAERVYVGMCNVVSKKSVGVLQRHVRENPKWPAIGTFLACHCDAAIPHAVAEPNRLNSCYLAIDMRKPQC